mgnify:CR=1 FL=1
MKLVKYFLQKKSLTILLLLLVLFGGLFAYVKMGKLEDALSGLRFLCSLPNMETHVIIGFSRK